MKNQFFKNIIYIKSADSTNTHLKETDYPDRTLIYTFDQTAGRGRADRRWLGFKGKSLALSFILRENVFKNPLWYIAAVSLALTEMLENDFEIKKVRIKWPNDVYIGAKKIAGVLAETVWKDNAVDKLVVGIGINISAGKKELSALQNEATSVFIESGKLVEAKEFFEIYLERLCTKLSLLYEAGNGVDILRSEWVNKCAIINKEVEWINAGETKSALVADLDPEGYLTLKINDTLVKAVSGEIKIIGEF